MLIPILFTASIASGYDRLPEFLSMAHAGHASGEQGIATVVTYADSPDVMALITSGLAKLTTTNDSAPTRIQGKLFCSTGEMMEGLCAQYTGLSPPYEALPYILRAEESFLSKRSVRWYVLFEDAEHHVLYVSTYIIGTFPASLMEGVERRDTLTRSLLKTGLTRSMKETEKSALVSEMVMDISTDDNRYYAMKIVEEFVFRAAVWVEEPGKSPDGELYEKYLSYARNNAIAEAESGFRIGPSKVMDQNTYVAFMSADPSPSDLDLAFMKTPIYNGGAFHATLPSVGGSATLTNFTTPKDTLAYVEANMREERPSRRPRLILLDEEPERGTLRIVVHELPESFAYSLRGAGLKVITKLMSFLVGKQRDALPSVFLLRVPARTPHERETASQVIQSLLGKPSLSPNMRPPMLYTILMPYAQYTGAPLVLPDPAPRDEAEPFTNYPKLWALIIILLLTTSLRHRLYRAYFRRKHELKKREEAEAARVALVQQEAAEEALRIERQRLAEEERAMKLAARREREAELASSPTNAPAKAEVSAEEIAELEARLAKLLADPKLPSSIGDKIKLEVAQAAEEKRLARRKKILVHALGHVSAD